MYESPITLYYAPTLREISEMADKLIATEVQRICPVVNEEELLKALKYDRGQYEKGYEDGKRDAPDIIHCKDCAHYVRHKDDYMCGINVLAYVHEYDFCSRAERIEVTE